MAGKQAARPGWKDGYRDGLLEGRRLGASEAIARHTVYAPPMLAKRILYIRSGLWSYAPLDDGIVDALRQLVREVHVATPDEDTVPLARQVRPDLALSLNSVECFPVAQVQALRDLGVRTAVWFTDDPYYIDTTRTIAPHYDDVFTLEASCVPLYREAGCERVACVPLGANTAYYAPRRTEAAYASDICFIGSAFDNRVAFFDRIASYLRRKRVVIAGYWWDRLSRYEALSGQIRNGSWLSPAETAAYYNRAKIVINMHRSIDDATNRNAGRVHAVSVNPRSFEISACAAFQLTDAREQLGTVFTPGLEAATYASPEELAEKAEYYLRHDEERQAIALRGYARTMREHTYPRRVRQLLETVFEYNRKR